MAMSDERKAFRELVIAEHKSDLEKLKKDRDYYSNRLKNFRNNMEFSFCSEMVALLDKDIQKTKKRIKIWSQDPTETNVKRKKRARPMFTDKF